MIRTTVRLDENIYKEARKKAIDEQVAFARIVNEALKAYLQGKMMVSPEPLTLRIKVYSMGRVKGNLSRTDLYENI